MNTTKWTRTLMGFALVGMMACGGGETEEAPIEEAPEAAAPAAPAAPELAATELANPAAHEGMTVQVSNLKVAGAVGTSAVWVELPTTPAPTQFLVRTPTPPAVGSTVTVVGTVHPVTPEVVEGWLSAGAISENDKLVVEFASHYLDATSVQPGM